jgi:hypothetical protein
MKILRSTILLLGTLLFVALPLMLAQARANIIDSTYGAGAGSFELGDFTGGVAGFVGLAPGATTITGWTVGGPGDGVDWLTAPNFGADTGIRSIDLTHITNSSISTVIPTVAGSVYQVSFGAASVTGLSVDGVVSAGSLLNQPFTAPFSSAFATQTYKSFAFAFTATGPTSEIVFRATGPADAICCYGPAIDNVSIVQAVVPEPDARQFLMAALGVMLGYSVWRKRIKRETEQQS